MGPEQRDARRVVAVVVTYRRRELLERCVDAIAGQSRPPDLTLVIDNGGDAREVLGGNRPGVEIMETGENLGPAGGYALGFAEALARDASAIWVVDDDVVPEPMCLERLAAAWVAGAEVAVPLSASPAACAASRRAGTARCSTRASSARLACRAPTCSSGWRTPNTPRGCWTSVTIARASPRPKSCI